MDDIQKYINAVSKIVLAQHMIMGPMAVDLARQVDGLSINTVKNDVENVEINEDPKLVLESLVGQYRKLFGDVSVNVSKDAISDLRGTFGDDELPSLLR
jgi:hypothetical protein